MEKKTIKKQLIKNLFITFITFTILLVLFDTLIYNLVSSTLYNTVDEELKIGKESYSDRRNEKEPILNDKKRPPVPLKEDDKKRKNDINPRLITIERDSNGNIINSEEILILYSNYSEDLLFDSNNLNSIYNISISGFKYRCINFSLKDNDNISYVQLLVNVDSENNSLNNLINVLIIGSIIVLAVSIIASYFISRRTLNPIIESYRKETEFVQNASHELRTPLTIIQAKQELLLQEPNSKIIDKSNDINISLQETRRLNKLIKELMILAKSDSNKYKLEKENVNIDKLIEEILNPYIELYSADRKIKLDLNNKKDYELDKDKISELLIILFDNAIKYTKEKDSITVKTFEENKKLIIQVIDTGIGISDESIDKIFDRFYREDKSHSRETGGNGLGLSIADIIVSSHGGTIKASHNKPKGTIFTVKI